MIYHSLSFLQSKGNSGVALQYCHARLNSLELSCGVPLPDADEPVNVDSLLGHPEAVALINAIARHVPNTEP